MPCNKTNTFSLLFMALFISTLTGCGGGVSSQTTTAPMPLGTLQSISVTPASPAIAASTNQQFIAIGTYINPNSTQEITNLATWASSNHSVAMINSAGVATSATAGASTISASYGGKTDSTTLTVTAATLTSIAVTPANPSIAAGAHQQFVATGTFSDSSSQNITSSVTWSSSSTAVATISNTAGSKGLASSNAAGTTTITATLGGISNTTKLTVTPAALVSITITPTNPSVSNGTTQQFTATGTYSDNTTQNLTTTVTWSSSSTSVATISNTAGTKGLATAVGVGTTTITAASGSISKTTILTVTGSSAVNLTWDAPTQFTDGSPLNPAADLQSYKLYYGTVSQAYTQVVTLSNPGTSTVTQSVTLPSGTYYFVVTSVSQSGNESLYSNEVSKSL